MRTVDITRVLARYLKKNQADLISVVGMKESSNNLNQMNDLPSKPNRRKLTLGDFTTIIMTQISSPETPLNTPVVKSEKGHHAK